MNCRWLLLTLLAFSVIGCGDPCGGADFGHANPGYAGSYAGVYDNFGGTAAAKDFDLTVAIDAAGQITGTVSEPSSGRTASVSGSVVDWDSACASSRTMLQLSFTFPNEAQRSLSGDRTQGQFQPWPFTARYALQGNVIGTGKLTLTKQ